MRVDKFTSSFQNILSDAQSLALKGDNQFIETFHLNISTRTSCSTSFACNLSPDQFMVCLVKMAPAKLLC
jgi:hypothetical protein